MTLDLAEIEQLEALHESWGEPVPFSEYPQNQGWDGSSNVETYFTSIEDRTEGRWRPYYDTEDDLARQRMIARRLPLFTSTRWAAMDSLRYFIFGSGPEIKAQAVKGQNTSTALVEQVNAIIQTFLEANEFTGNMDWELHDRSREDGEALVALDVDDGQIIAEIVEPDQLTEPRSPFHLYDWIRSQFGVDCGSFVPQWQFGVLRKQRRPSQPLGYHVVYDGSGRDWDFYPSSRFCHIKRNVGRAAPRGVSDFMPVWDDMKTESKLGRNVGRGAALQAAIAWVEEFPDGTTQKQAEGIGKTDLTYKKQTESGGRTQRVSRLEPGSIVRVSAGKKYIPGPMGSERNPGFLLAAQYIFRRVGIRWLMPEYMISGDASNANYSSTIVAESPFVKAREADQQFYGQHIKSLMWKVVLLAKQLGWLRTDVPWDVLRKSVEITVNWPDVVTRNITELVGKLKSEVEMGVTSLRTAATELDRDYDEEVASGAKPAVVATSPFSMQESHLGNVAESLKEAVKTGWQDYP